MLGTVDVPKASVRITAVHERVSVAATFHMRKVNVGGNGIGLGLFEPPKWVHLYETLNLKDDSADSNKTADSGIYVSVGDPVVQVLDSETIEEHGPDSEGPETPPFGHRRRNSICKASKG